MENWDKRVQATLFIWIGVGVALGFSGAGDVSNFSDEIITIILAGAACVSTLGVWFFGREGLPMRQNNKKADSRQGEKAKNENAYEDARVRLLLEMLDEDQRVALKQQLMDELQADGEPVSLSDLLNEEPQRRRH